MGGGLQAPRPQTTQAKRNHGENGGGVQPRFSPELSPGSFEKQKDVPPRSLIRTLRKYLGWKQFLQWFPWWLGAHNSQHLLRPPSTQAKGNHCENWGFSTQPLLNFACGPLPQPPGVTERYRWPLSHLRGNTEFYRWLLSHLRGVTEFWRWPLSHLRGVTEFPPGRYRIWPVAPLTPPGRYRWMATQNLGAESVERAWGFPTLSQHSQLLSFVLSTPVVRAPRSVTPRRCERGHRWNSVTPRWCERGHR